MTVNAKSINGAIGLSLPASVTYAVSASTIVGVSSSTVPTDPGSGRHISASTTIGSVTIRARH